MSADSRLRELERLFKESGSIEDEAAYLRELLRVGSNGDGFTTDELNVLSHRLIQAGLSRQDAEKLFNSPSLPHRLLEVIREHEEPRSPPEGEYADEEEESNYGYPEEFRFRTPEEQVRVWRQHFPDLDASQVEELASIERPEGAESRGVIPKPSRIAGDYHEALERILGIITEQHPFQNWQEGQLGPEHLRLTQRTQARLDEQERDQPGDFLVFPFQFGLRHRGRSVRRAQAVFSLNEVGLGPYEVAALLATHPDRITGYDQLHGIDCAGCEYDPGMAGGFGFSLAFYWIDDELGLADYSIAGVGDSYGSASAFGP